MLYLVATPIGNLEDITLRALRVLKEVDFIACEDTRVTMKLLNHFEIKKSLISYYQHNEKASSKQIIERLKNGENGALVTDAGMPAISDPGEEIVRECIEQNIDFTVLPGCSACVSALAISGQNTSRFTFEGFLSVNRKSRNEHLEQIKEYTNTIIMYEAPHKLIKTLCDLYKALGNRSITIIRELTKMFEQSIKTNLEDAQSLYIEKPPKGEFVLIIEGKNEVEEKASIDTVRQTFEELINDGRSKSDAIKEVSEIYNIKKNELYNILAR